MKIVVSADHVRAGKACSCSECPIALAILDRLRASATGVNCIEVAACRVHIQWHRYGPWTSHKLPVSAARFITAFDAGGSPAPFEFELPLGDLDPDPTNTPAAVAA